jgi:hypothetical protein
VETSTISVLVPSRGRPESMLALSETFAETCSVRSTMLHWIVDEDDPALEAYRDAFHASVWRSIALWVVPRGGPAGIVHPLNYVAQLMTSKAESIATSKIMGFMGDDHRPRTPEWDGKVLDAYLVSKPRILYGDDLLQGENLPTSVFLTSDIIRALGYMAPPELRHLYVDDFWRDLGRHAGCIEYHPEIVIEHLHYTIGKSAKDETYEQNNNAKAARKDRIAWQLYKHSGAFLRDVKTVRALM